MQQDLLVFLNSIDGLSSLDVHFARFLHGIDGRARPELGFAAAWVSSYTRQGHICISLAHLSELQADRLVPGLDLGEWRKVLSESPVIGAPGEFKPLILDGAGRLYLYRYWEYQDKLARELRARIDASKAFPDSSSLKSSLEKFFEKNSETVDWQKVAAFRAASSNFCAVSGGPGTGKTTTVAKILAVLIEQSAPEKPAIALAAPTGKAAARLKEALRGSAFFADCPDEIRKAFPEDASTIHRLLGNIPGSPYFKYNEENKLPLDVLIIDEASMVDLALMSKLVQALPRQARLILLGDMDQLASVEAGSVLGDICETGKKMLFSPAFIEAVEKTCGGAIGVEDRAGNGERAKDCVIQLRKSYRFGDGIAAFSQAIRDRDQELAVSVLGANKYSDLVWRTVSGRPAGELGSEIIAGYREYLEWTAALSDGDVDNPEERIGGIFGAFEKFRVLCALREGHFGVSAMNSAIEDILYRARLLPRLGEWYHGRPVMITRNDYGLRLFNGDIGIYLPDVVTGSESRVFFPGEAGKLRFFHPLRLPAHETVFAMTVHKSQGSEFDKVLFLLPDTNSPVLTRELLYTAVTRARNRVTVVGSEEIVRSGIARSTDRLSGLSEILWARKE